jgi:hypothetical protein
MCPLTLSPLPHPGLCQYFRSCPQTAPTAQKLLGTVGRMMSMAGSSLVVGGSIAQDLGGKTASESL